MVFLNCSLACMFNFLSLLLGRVACIASGALVDLRCEGGVMGRIERVLAWNTLC